MPGKKQLLFYEIIKQSLHRINACRHRDPSVIYIYIYIYLHTHIFTEPSLKQNKKVQFVFYNVVFCKLSNMVDTLHVYQWSTRIKPIHASVRPKECDLKKIKLFCVHDSRAST